MPTYTPLQTEAGPVEVPAVLRREERSRSARRGRRFLRLLHANDPLVAFYCSCLVNVPQIIATIVVFTVFGESDAHLCSKVARTQWRAWGVVHALRLTAGTLVSAGRARLAHTAPRNGPETEGRRRLRALAANARNSLDALALIWFVVGNMWLLGGAAGGACAEASRSPVYATDVAMLAVQYAQICLPCLFAVAMVPVFCFCLPCVIRLLAALHDPQHGRGATRRDLDKLPTCPFSSDFELLKGEEPCCPVCICDYEENDNLRVLPCSHVFHADCVDQWLAVNATCPLCRKSIFVPDSDVEDPPTPPPPGSPPGPGGGLNLI